MRFSTAILLFSAIFWAGKCQNLNDIVGTDQYMMLTQVGCSLYAEADIHDAKCPLVPRLLSDNKRDRCPLNQEIVNIHLIRDPEGVKSPKIVTLFRYPDALRIIIRDFNLSSMITVNNDKVWRLDAKNNLPFRQFSLTGSHMRNIGVKYSLYDSVANTLYIFNTGADSEFEAHGFYLGDLFNDEKYTNNYFSQIALTLRAVTLQGDIKRKFDFTEDPYTNTAYYKEYNVEKNITEVFTFPISNIWDILIAGKSGKKLYEFGGTRSHMTGGGVIVDRELQKKDTEVLVLNHYTNTTKKTENSMYCQYSMQLDGTMWSRLPVIFLKYQDYCLVRYGPEYDREECDNHHIEWLESKGHATGEEESSLDVMKWLIISVIVLSAIVVLLLVYIYWLRSTFVTDDERTHHNEYETEASLFVAKQRSFPSAYPDPALLDVSVDRWN